jgi:subtilisin family serine protease
MGPDLAPPSPASVIGIGASTLFDTVGTSESIASADQIAGGDVMSWSNRGPGARNTGGVDVVATGAFGTGSEPLNAVLDGSIATLSFGGTSMAAPVAAGNLALVYQAFREANDRWPTFEEAPAGVEAGSPAEVAVSWDTEGLEPGEYEGLVVVGPEVAAGLFRIPVTVTIE